MHFKYQAKEHLGARVQWVNEKTVLGTSEIFLAEYSHDVFSAEAQKGL